MAKQYQVESWYGDVHVTLYQVGSGRVLMPSDPYRIEVKRGRKLLDSEDNIRPANAMNRYGHYCNKADRGDYDRSR